MRATGAISDMGLGFRRTSKVHGSANFVSSRLAELYHIDILAPARSGTPPTSTSRVRLRRMKMMGDAHRTISSTAVGATPSKSFHHLARSSG